MSILCTFRSTNSFAMRKTIILIVLTMTILTACKPVVKDQNVDPKESFYIVGAVEANPSGGKISNESPLGRALLDHKKNDMVAVEAPDGEFNVKILRVS